MSNTKLTLADISDMRAYERERLAFRARVIDLKKRRRIHVGPVITLLFESRDTVRFQVQEMARAEKMFSDEQIQTELDIYNPLIPEPGQLTATLFIELTSQEEMTQWLPKLVGVERSIEFLLGEGESAEVVHCQVDSEHAERLTRDEVTASVHYVQFAFEPAQIDRFATDAVVLAVNHLNYTDETHLSEETKALLLADLRDEPAPQP